MNRPWLSHYHVASRAAYPVHPVSGFLESAARRTPDKLAVLDGRERATYRELAQRVARMDLPIEPGDRVVLRMENSLGFVAAFCAVVRAGGIAVPTRPRAALQAVVEAVIEDCAPALVLEREPEPGAPRVPAARPRRA